MNCHHYFKSFLLLFLQIVLLGMPCFAQTVTFDRVYTKVESSTGEHCSGWTIELWKTGTGFVGTADHHRGLCGDPPTGLLENVRYDIHSGSLSFSIKLSDSSDGYGKYSCDSLTFIGYLTADKLVGIMNWESAGIKRPSESLDLDRANAAPYGNRVYDSVADWVRSRGDILEFRGPRC